MYCYNQVQNILVFTFSGFFLILSLDFHLPPLSCWHALWNCVVIGRAALQPATCARLSRTPAYHSCRSLFPQYLMIHAVPHWSLILQQNYYFWGWDGGDLTASYWTSLAATSDFISLNKGKTAASLSSFVPLCSVEIRNAFQLSLTWVVCCAVTVPSSNNVEFSEFSQRPDCPYPQCCPLPRSNIAS